MISIFSLHKNNLYARELGVSFSILICSSFSNSFNIFMTVFLETVCFTPLTNSSLLQPGLLLKKLLMSSLRLLSLISLSSFATFFMAIIYQLEYYCVYLGTQMDILIYRYVNTLAKFLILSCI